MSYIISGEVIQGNRIGRQLGFPTANLHLQDDRLKDGVYAVRILVEGTWHNGVANVGTRPTVTSDPGRFLEAYIFNFDENIYGKTIKVELKRFLRPEQKFASVEELRLQIEKDKKQAETVLKEPTSLFEKRDTKNV